MTDLISVDSTLSEAQQNHVVEDNKQTGEVIENESPQVEEEQTSKSTPEVAETYESEDGSGSQGENESTPSEGSESTEETADLDEYGNKHVKERTYTQEEVNKMIRERLSRGRNAEQPVTQQQQQQVQDNFQPDSNSEESWEKQLEQFIDNTIQKRTVQQQQKEWQEKEQRLQSEFENKFTEGMDKYSDFREVVADKPITDSIMMAVRGMKDPAAFIYAASKTQAPELERISKLGDPIQQAAEIGRLDVKMRKARAPTSAPKPVEVNKGDVKGVPDNNIDSMIHAYAKNKYKR